MQNEFEEGKVLITGGLGFMGANLARRIAGLGADQLSILETCRAYHPKIRIIFASNRQSYGRAACAKHTRRSATGS
jgi:nucleoside-diphosphate-sugar epimerase